MLNLAKSDVFHSTRRSVPVKQIDRERVHRERLRRNYLCVCVSGQPRALFLMSGWSSLPVWGMTSFSPPPPSAVSSLLKYACSALLHSIFYFGFVDNDGGTEGRGGGTNDKRGERQH